MKRIKISKKNIIWSAICGFAYAFIFGFGHQLEVDRSINFHVASTWTTLLWYWILWGVGFLLFFSFRPKVKKKTQREFSWIFFLSCMVIIGTIWFVALLGAYPGFFAYDSSWQWAMYQTGKITEHHPILHTLFIGWMMQLGLWINGTYELGVFLYIIIQLILTDVAMSYMVSYFYKKGMSWIGLLLSLAWITCTPMVSISVITVTKDSLFAAFFVPFIILSIQMVEEPDYFFAKGYHSVIWGITAVLSTILRNNAIYPMFVFLVVLLVINRNYLKKYMMILGGVILTFSLYTGPFCNVVSIARLNNKEFLSVPIQQVLWVYKNEKDSLSIEDQNAIEKVFGEKGIKYYNPRIADMPKLQMNYEDYAANPKAYWKFWLRLGYTYPLDYINSFLENSYGYWYPFATLTMVWNGEERYAQCECQEPVTLQSKIPIVLNYLKKMESSYTVMHRNSTKWIFAMGTYFCLFFLAFVLVIMNRQKSAFIFGFIFLYWLTFLLGPVALVRYMTFLFYLVPLFLWSIVRKYD